MRQKPFTHPLGQLYPGQKKIIFFSGAFALLGSVSFFAGVTRLTISLTVIMVEITNDIHQLLLIMISIMVAKVYSKIDS